MTEAPLERVESRRVAAPVRAARGVLSDESLARRVAAGEREAFGALFERYRGPLSRYCRSIVHDREEAADALQNAMLAALAGLEREAPSGPLRPWLYRIAHNESINLIRRRMRSHEDLVAETPDLSDLAAPGEVAEQIRALFGDLAELPERQRGALVMRELAGLDYDQIGRVFATSAVAARKLVYEARIGLHAQREGRASSCEAVLRQLSDGDGRSVRGRVLRAHLRTCDSCAAFERSLRVRAERFALIPALPVLGGGLWLAGGLGGGAGASKALAGAGVAAGSTAVGAGAGGALSGAVVSGAGGAMAVKCLAVCGALAVVGAGTAMVGDHPRSHHPRPPLSASVAHLRRPAAHSVIAAVVNPAPASATAHAGTGEPTATGPADPVRTMTSRRRPTAHVTSLPPAAVTRTPTVTNAPSPATTSTTAAAVSTPTTAMPAPSAPTAGSAASTPPIGVPASAEPTPADSSDPEATGASQLAAAAAVAASQAQSAISSAAQAASSEADQFSSSLGAMFGALSQGDSSQSQNSSD